VTRWRRRRSPPPAPAPPPPPPTPDWTARDVPVQGLGDQPVTRRLYERLRPEDLEAFMAALDPQSKAIWDETPVPERPTLVLCFGAWKAVPEVLERTGLVPGEPPPEVHAMSRGPLAAAGDLYSADLVLEGLAAAGGDVARVRRALDFGCSSGRTLRPLSAAYPEVEWHGADPNAASVAWAAEHLPGVRFSVSGSEPPLEFPDAHFDLVLAISIWSHFGEGAAARWLAEMHRIVAPGGHLVITVHGPQAVAYYGMRGERPPEQLDEIVRALHRHGFWYAREFGEEGDFGIVHPEWGTAFMSPEWLLRTVTPDWHVASYGVGRNLGNQDVAVLRRC
jgi:SAM-dependent methyltransferase